jgi:outer membrane protein
VAQVFLPAIIFDPTADPGELIPVRFGATNQWQSALTVEQALFDPAVFVGLGAAGRFRNLQRESMRGREQETVTRTRIAYYNLLLAQEQTRLTENSVRRVRESLDETRALNRAGLAADFDVLRLEVELANLEPNLLRAENAESETRRQLAIELAVEDLDDISVAGSLAQIELDDFDANSPENRQILEFGGEGMGATLSSKALLEVAADARSDLLQLGLTEDLRRTELRLEQVQYLPDIAVFGSYSVTAQQDGAPNFFGNENQRTTGAFVGLRVSVPIFSGFSRDARIDQKRAQIRQAEAQTRLATDRAEGEIKTLGERVAEAVQRARAQRFAVRQAIRGFEIASSQYREGLSSRLERTDAEVALRQSEFNYAQAVYDFLVARAQLDQAVGRVPMVDGAVTIQ